MKMETMTAATSGATRPGFHLNVLPWLVLAAGITASFFLFALVRDSVENVARLRFEREAKDANGIIEDRLRSYVDVLYALRALFASEGPADRLRFRRFIESLDLKHRYPGFDSLNYAAYVLAKDRKRFEEAVRRDTSIDPRGYPRFAIKPPGERPEYFVVVYLEPMAGYEFAFGLDLAANPMAADPSKVAAAVRSQRDNGTLVSSAQPLRIKRARESVYLAMRLAAYKNGMPLDTVEQRRAAYVGSIGAGFDVENLMKGVLKEEMLEYMRIRLHDVGPATRDSSEARRLLFDSDQLTKVSPTQSEIGNSDSVFVHVLPIEIASRIWEFQYTAPKNAVMSRLDTVWPSWVLAGGVLSSLLLFGMLYSASLSRSRALALAAQMTKDLRETEERFRLIAESASDLIILIDPQGQRLYVNPAYGRLFAGYEGFVGTDAFQEIHPEDKEQVRKAFFETVGDGQNRDVEFR